ncbi:MAG: patatin family protein [Bacteroidaceae bacterium]|nr:patatin family protein [Bacteroidaceae bacterium]
MKKGLVLEGGGLRALFSAGVTDVMMENQIKFDGLIGVSAGATFGCNYKSEQSGRALRYNIALKDDPRYMGWRSFLKTGDLVGADFSYHILPTQLDIFDNEAFCRNPMEFHVVCTDAETGEPVYKKLDTMDSEGLDWIRASASMPIVSRPVPLEGRKLLDGGIVNSIPLKHFQELGFERNIVVLTQPKGFFKKRTKLMPLFHLTMRKYPAIIKAMSRRHLMYNEQLRYLTEQESRGNVLLIYPENTLPIGRTEQNEEKMRFVYQMGRTCAEENLKNILNFLQVEN